MQQKTPEQSLSSGDKANHMISDIFISYLLIIFSKIGKKANNGVGLMQLK